MTENGPDSNDSFEDQLTDVGNRTKDKLSEQERKKAEKLGVSPVSAEDTDDGAETSSDSEPETADPTAEAGSDVEPSARNGEEYEYDEMDTKAKAESADESQLHGTMAKLSTTGQRMAVTKHEADFVTGAEAETEEREKTKFLYFELNDELFAAPLESISSVEELSGLTRYPRSPEPIDGVTDMRGKIIAVLNPKVIVDLSDAAHEQGEGGDYIIVQEEMEDEHRTGVRVDDVSHVEAATEDEITPIYDITEMDLVTIDETYLEGIIHGYRDDDRAQVPWVDFESLVATLKEY